MLRFAGYLLLLLSLLSAAVLLAAPLGFDGIRAGFALWVLFPATLLAGFLLASLGAQPAAVGMLLRVIGVALVGLGCIAVVLLVLTSIGVLETAGAMAGAWVLAPAGLVLGAFALTARGQQK